MIITLSQETADLLLLLLLLFLEKIFVWEQTGFSLQISEIEAQNILKISVSLKLNFLIFSLPFRYNYVKKGLCEQYSNVSFLISCKSILTHDLHSSGNFFDVCSGNSDNRFFISCRWLWLVFPSFILAHCVSRSILKKTLPRNE